MLRIVQRFYTLVEIVFLNLPLWCYKSSYEIRHTFKLEQWMHYGPVILGAFASSSQNEIAAFHTICKEIIRRQKCGLRHYLSSNKGDDEIDNTSTLIKPLSRQHIIVFYTTYHCCFSHIFVYQYRSPFFKQHQVCTKH